MIMKFKNSIGRCSNEDGEEARGGQQQSRGDGSDEKSTFLYDQGSSRGSSK